MRLDRSHWIALALVTATGCAAPADGGASSIAGVGGSCRSAPAIEGTGGASPLELVSATLVSGTELSLVFSEAVTAPSGVDPTAFRLSAVETLRAGAEFRQRVSYGTTVFGHYAPSATNCFPDASHCSGSVCSCTEVETAPCDETFYYEIAPFAALAPGAAANELVATLAQPIHATVNLGPGSVPPQLEQSGPCGALFLHYTAPSRGVQDAAGNPLRSIAPTWARATASTLKVGGVRSENPMHVARDILDAFCAGHGCHDGIADGLETDVDCGGIARGCIAKRCDLGQRCVSAGDCMSRSCEAGICQGPSCTDGQANGGETDVDCGGSTTCPRCSNGGSCVVGADCESATCVRTWAAVDAHGLPGGYVCGEPSCADGEQNGAETGVDCGGSCAGCVGDPCTLGADCASGTCSSPALVCARAVATAISAGSCALSSTGGIKCWGSGTTQVFATRPVDIAGLTSGAVAVSMSGFGPACALTSAGGVACWGSNAEGQLGDGTTTDRVTPVDVSGLTSGVAAIATGGSHACALMTAGGIKCWGRNDDGELGDGTTTQRKTPVDVVGLASGVAAVSAGNGLTCALMTTGGVKCWGIHVGDGTTETRNTPVDVSGLASGVIAISAGGSTIGGPTPGFACALTSAGGVKCWGVNPYGELGDGTTVMKRLTPVDVVGLGSGVSAISAGTGCACAVTSAGGAVCWGFLTGDGTSNSSSTPVGVVGLASGVTAISAGNRVMCALTTAGRAWCWGDNEFGAVGDGTTTRRFSPTEVYGL